MATAKKAAPEPVVAQEDAMDGLPGAGEQLDAGDPPMEPVRVAPAPTKATRAHYTVCAVVGLDVVSENRTYPVGSVAEFPNSDVASLPGILVPIAD